jgi:hypothetical protein
LIGSFLILERADLRDYHTGYRVACHDPTRPFRGLILGEGLGKERRLVQAYAASHPIQVIRDGYAHWEPLPVLTRDQFVHEVFLPEVYELGSLCVGYHLGFDLVRLAVRCTTGRKRNRDAFRVELCEHTHHPAIYLQVVSNKQTFIRFASVPPPQGRTISRGRVAFRGRFLDIRQGVYALTGEAGDLESDCAKFGIESRKLPVSRLGMVTEDLVSYNVHDTETLTAALFIVLQNAYLAYTDIATDASEYHNWGKRPITEMYSPATLGKAHLDAMDISPPTFVISSSEVDSVAP